MRDFLRAFGVIFYIGFFALVAALAYSLMTFGVLFAEHEVLAALRAFGGAYIAAGLAMWVMLRREEAGKGGINPLLGFLILAGAAFTLIAVAFFSRPFSDLLQLAGFGAAAGGLLIALIVTVFDPAFPKPVSKSWPEGGTAVLTRFAHADDHGPTYGSMQPEDDLTVIAGVTPEVVEVLHASDVHTYEELAGYDAEELSQLLRMAELPEPAVEPGSWPAQAELAAQGQWEALEQLKAELAAGRPV